MDFPDAINATGDVRIDALLSGYKLTGTTVTYSFYEDSVFAGQYYGSEAPSEVSEPVKSNVRTIMALYSTIMNVNFVEVAETASTIGYIRIMKSTAPSYAYAYYPIGTGMFSTAGDIHLNSSYDRLGDTNGFQHPAGQHGYVSLIHEIGHTVGLKHPFSGTPTLPTNQDNFATTVMTYNFLGNSPGTMMGYDLMALNYLYTLRASRTGDDTYVATRNAVDQYRLGTTLYINPSNPTKHTIWDSGGYNTLDLSELTGSASGYRIDMKPLGWISTGSAFQTTYFVAGLSIGPGVSFRKVVNSVSNDTIYANSEANLIGGYAANRATGTDALYDADGADTIDLSGYQSNQVIPTPSGNDLVLNFGANGSLRIVGYFSMPTNPAIVYAGGGVTPAVSINDPSVTEGNSGTTPAVFTLNLSSAPTSTVSVNWATGNDSATSPSDFTAASGTVSFAAGETQKTVTVNVIGDQNVELTEYFRVQLSGANGLTIADTEGIGQILNDDTTPNQPPVAVVSANPTSGQAPLPVQFTGSNSSDPDGSIASYAWTFGDGGTSTQANPARTYANAGTYTATLTVTDNRGGTASNSVVITVTAVPNQPPVAVVSANPTNGQAPLPVQFTGSNSSDPDGSIASYAWTFGDGGTSTQANPSRTYANAGTYTATLTVTDNRGGTASNSVVITVTAAPVLSMRVSALTGQLLSQGANKYVRMTVTVLDANNQPVSGAVVSGAWSGLVSGSASATTNANGQATVDSPKSKKSGNVTLTISNVTRSGYTYNAAGSVTSQTVAVP